MIKDLIYKFFNDDDFLRISKKIKEVEKTTSGEVRVSIKEKRNFRQRGKDIRKLAEEEFYRLGMDKTRDNTGILIFILLEERKYYILADSGINSKVSQATWDSVRDKMKEYFKKGEFSNGVIFAINEAGRILSENFPIKPEDKDELSNKVVLG